MCGFCGFISNVTEKEEKIRKMTDKIIYRGPDSSGEYLDTDIALGFRRLSIIDLDKGTQPIYNEDKTKVIVCNGEIYNYMDIRKELIEKGHIFFTKSDTEVLLHGYEEYGERILDKLRGMFSFAIWDKETKELFMARDLFGIKPMYYANVNNTFLFGSEIKTILEYPDFQKEFNKKALQNYLSFQYSVPNDTFFKDIYCLPAAHYLKYKEGNITIKRYWKPEFYEDNNMNFDDAISKIDELVKDSVSVHETSDVEVGCFLSGGVDSSYIASQTQGKKAFTVGFDYDKYNEVGYAKEISKHLGLEHYTKIITKEEYWEAIPKIQYYMDQPLADPSCVPLYFVSKLASEHVKVVLSGEGADEIFGGYGIYHEPFSIKKTKILPKIIWKVLSVIVNCVPTSFKGKSLISRAALNIEERYIGNANIFSEKEKIKILRSINKNSKSKEIVAPFFEEVKGKEDTTKMQYIDMHFWLVGDILLKADRMSMANSLELRVPFLDKKIFELASTLPLKYKVTPKATKYAMRYAALQNLPEEVSKRKKLGFPVPIRLWLKEEVYYQKVKQEFISDTAKEYFNTREILRLLEEHYKGEKDNSRKIWTIYIFLVWYKIYFEDKNEISLDKKQVLDYDTGKSC